MRRLLLSITAFCSLSILTGCTAYCTRGICDCAYDDYCSSRSPWIRMGGPVSASEISTVPGAPAVAPATLPKAMPSSTPKMPPPAPTSARDLPPIVTPEKGL